MTRRVRAVIVQDKKVLTIKRCKSNGVYFVLPGGGVLTDENDESALLRECFEELGVTVKVKELFFQQIFNNESENFYLCEILSDQALRPNGPEYQNMKSNNSYEPHWVEISELININLKPNAIIQKLFTLL